MSQDAERTLTSLGFSEMEANAYCALLRHGPGTAYQVARAIGKAAPNTYGALGSLAQKGAVEVADGDGPKVYRPMPPDSLLAGLARQFQSRHDAAGAALRGLATADDDGRLFRLNSYDQVIDRARLLISGATETLIFDMFPEVVETFLPDLDAAVERGVLVAGLVYAPPSTDRPWCVRSRTPASVLERWPGRQLTIISDARAHLLALLGDGAPIHAMWSSSRYLSCLQHSGLAAEIRIAAMTPAGAGDLFAPIGLLNAYPPGLKDLIGPRDVRCPAALETT